MPKIREYEQQTNVSGPVEPRLNAKESPVGDALAGFGQQVSQAGDTIYKSIEQKEVSQLNADMSGLQATQTLDLKKRIDSGENPDLVVEDTLRKYDEAAAKLRDKVSTVGGRNYFTTSNANLRNHFLQSATEGQAQLAGEKAKQDLQTSINNRSSSLLSDPSQLELSLQETDKDLKVKVASGQIAEVDRLKILKSVEANYAKSAVKGLIDINPEYAKKKLADGTYNKYLDGLEKDALNSEADTAITAKRLEGERFLKERERELELKRTARENDFIQLFVQGKLSPKMVANDELLKPTEGSGSKKAFLAMIEADNKSGGGLKTDTGTFLNIFTRITLEDGDPKKLTDENQLNKYFAQGLLSKEDLQFLRNEMQGKKTIEGGIDFEFKKNFLANAKRRLTGSNDMTGVKDIQGDVQYNKFLHYALPAIEEGRKKGKTMQQLTDPASPDYVGKILDTPAFYKTRSQILRGNIRGYRPAAIQNPEDPNAKNAPPVPITPQIPKQEGESLEAYIKRTGKS